VPDLSLPCHGPALRPALSFLRLIMHFGMFPLGFRVEYQYIHGIKGSAFAEFRPTPASIPPPNALYTLNTPPGLAINFHPLVPSTFKSPISGYSNVFWSRTLSSFSCVQRKYTLTNLRLPIQMCSSLSSTRTLSGMTFWHVYPFSVLHAFCQGTAGTELCVWSPSGRHPSW